METTTIVIIVVVVTLLLLAVGFWFFKNYRDSQKELYQTDSNDFFLTKNPGLGTYYNDKGDMVMVPPSKLERARKLNYTKYDPYKR